MTSAAQGKAMNGLRVLVACEHTGRVRNAFAALGHDAWSCDILPTTNPGQHIQDDVRNHLSEGWDLMVAHPECRYLANSGSKWLYNGGRKENGRDEDRWQKMREGAAFFLELWNADIPHIAAENPVMHEHGAAVIGMRPTQIVQPWWFGTKELKATGWYLKNLPPLQKTNVVTPPTDPTERRKWARVHHEPPGPDRWKARSVVAQGMVDALAHQWGRYVAHHRGRG